MSAAFASDDWFIETVYPNSIRDDLIRVRAALEFIRMLHGDGFMERNAELLSSGSPTARKFAAYAFESYVVNDASTAVTRNKGSDPQYSKKVLKQWETSMLSEVVQAWAYGAVRDELGLRLPYNVKVDHEEKRAIINAYLRDVTTPKMTVDKAYWRGVAVLAIKGITKPASFSNSDRQRFLELAQWIGKQTDIVPVAAVLGEREMTDVASLQSVIKEQQDLTIPLTDGAL